MAARAMPQGEGGPVRIDMAAPPALFQNSGPVENALTASGFQPFTRPFAAHSFL